MSIHFQRRARKARHLQEHQPRSVAGPRGRTQSTVFLWGRWIHESSATARQGYHVFQLIAPSNKCVSGCFAFSRSISATHRAFRPPSIKMFLRLGIVVSFSLLVRNQTPCYYRLQYIVHKDSEFPEIVPCYQYYYTEYGDKNFLLFLVRSRGALWPCELLMAHFGGHVCSMVILRQPLPTIEKKKKKIDPAFAYLIPIKISPPFPPFFAQW